MLSAVIVPLVQVATLLAMLAPAQSAAAAGAVTLDGVRVHLRQGTTQVVTVNHTSGYYARVSLWSLVDGHWTCVLHTTDGRIGYGGLVAGAKRVQNTGTTPLGTYRLLGSFGTHPRKPRWHLRYRKIKPGDYWVGDNASRYYNRYRNKAKGGFRWRLPADDANGSEHLADYPVQYEYAINTGFNRQQVRHRGSAIFLHVNGSGSTAGCVSVPRWFMRSLFVRLRPARHPEIAIGR